MKKLFYLLIVLLFTAPAFSQQQLRPAKDLSFYEVQELFNKYWEGKTIEKGKGYKPFKRWEWFWEQRVGPTGRFPKNSIVVEEWNKYVQSHTQAGYRMAGPSSPSVQSTTGNWVEKGPSTTPGGYEGIGRINCMAFHPTDVNTFWVGTPAGGIWKTTDGGSTWTTTSDNNPVLGVSDIAVNPNNPDIMYIATGDADRGSMWSIQNMNSGDTKSIGILKSTDGGVTWNTTGLSFNVINSALIGRILINPQNPNSLLAATTSGIYKSINAGANWSQVRTGNFIDMDYKPGDTTIVYATTFSFASSANVWRSVNGGTTWTQATTFNTMNRIKLAVTPANPALVNILCSDASDDGLAGIYSSTNSGVSFSLLYNTVNLLNSSANGSGTGGQGSYDLAYAISPTNANLQFVGGVNGWKSTNGGTSWAMNTYWQSFGLPSGATVVHADKHGIEFHPLNPSIIFQLNDGGIYKTTNAGTSWTDISNGLGITQFYRLATSQSNANLILGGAQDNGTRRLNTSTWSYATGGDGMDCAYDPTNASYAYASYVQGQIYRSTDGFATQGNITTISDNIPGAPIGAWLTPFVVDPNTTTTLYAGYQDVYKTTDRGNSWTSISSNLTGGNDINYIAVAPSNSQVLVAGTFSSIYRTSNGGTNWTNISAGLPTGSVSIVNCAIHATDPQTMWVVTSGYSAANKVFKTTNGGANWTNITGTLPNLPVNCIVYENNSNGGTYIGTDVGVFYRSSAMSDWISFNTGLPNVPVTDIEIQYSSSKLRVATFGRGIWESDLYTTGTVAPVANFTGTPTTITSGGTVTFTDNSTNVPTSWAWTANPTTGVSWNTATSQNPTATFANPGSYEITLTATNSNGSDSETKTAYITVLAPSTSACDTLSNILSTDNLTVYGLSGAWGYLPGHNQYLMSEYADKFTNTQTGTISKLFVPVAQADALSTGAAVIFKVYGAGATPGTVLGSQTVPMGSLTAGSYNVVTFSTPVAVTGDFYVGYELAYTAPQDTFAVYLAQDRTTGSATAFAKYNGNWSDINTLFSGFYTSLGIEPEFCVPTVAPVADFSPGNTTICAGQSITFTDLSTGGPTSWSWTFGGGAPATSTLQNPGAVVFSAAGTYTVQLTATNASGSNSKSVTITVNAAPSATASSNSPLCVGQTLNLTGGPSSMTGYSWSGPATFTAATQNPVRSNVTTAHAGTYTLTVTGANGCTKTATVPVVINALPTTTATSNSPVCVGQNLNLTGGPAGMTTYAWSGPATFTASTQNPVRSNVTATHAGTYTLTATNANGCSKTATVAVVINALPVTTASSNSPLCAGQTLNLTGGPASMTSYSWTGPATFTASTQNAVRSNVTTTHAGTYTLTATNANGCSKTATVPVVINAAPSATATSNSPLCVGQTLNLTGGPASMTSYSWSGPATFTAATQNAVRSNVTTAHAGTYTLTVTGTNGCTKTATVPVVVNALPTTTATSNSPVCVGQSLNLTGGPAGMTSYSWSGPATFTASTQSPVRSNVTTAHAGTYTLTATNSNGCSKTATVAVVVNALPAVTASANSPLCAGQTLNLSGSPAGMSSYSWTGPGTFTATTQNPVRSNVTTAHAGTYTLTATNANGCTNVATVPVVINAAPSATASANSPLCVGQTLNLTGGPAAMTSYSWSGPSSFTASTQNPVRSGVTTAHAGTYTLTVTNSNGCTKTATVPVVINPLPTASATSNSPVCVGGTLSLTGAPSGMSSYSWTGPASFTSTIQNPVRTNVTTAHAGTYTLTVVAAGGCSSTATTVVNINTLPTATASSNSPVCNGDNISLSGGVSGMSSYSWSGPNSFSSTIQNPTRSNAVSAHAGTYTLTVTNSNGCTKTATTTVVVNANPVATASSNSPLCDGQTLTINGGPAGMTAYTWTGPNGFASSGTTVSIPNANNTHAGTYTLAVVNSNGCTDEVTAVVSINPSLVVSVTSNAPVCQGDNLSLNATPTGSNTYSWSGPNGFSSTVANPMIPAVNATNAGTYSVTVSNGVCQGVGSIVVNIHASPGTPVVTQSTDTLYSSSASGNQWYDDNGPISGATNNYYVPSVTGNYYVEYTDANGCVSDTAIHYHYLFIGVNETTSRAFSIIPNPNNGSFIVETQGIENATVIQITNVLGELVYSHTLQKGQSRSEIDLGTVATGTYYVMILDDNHIMLKKQLLITR